MGERKYLNIIKNLLRDPIQNYKVKGGYGNTVFEINQEWIFRFSKEEIDLRQLKIEKSFLLQFEKFSPIPVPHIEFKGNDFIGYKKIEGVPIDEFYAKISPEQKNNAWELVGRFLKQLHTTNFQHTKLVEYPLGDKNFWNDLWKPVATKLSEETKKNAFMYFTEYFEESAKHPFKKTICHGDFHPNHILYNQQSSSISGIIDFGRICLGDPAIDFNLIDRFFGTDALNIVLKYYKQDKSEHFKKRIIFQNRRRLFAAFFHAKNIGQASSFPRYVKRIEDVFSNYKNT